MGSYSTQFDESNCFQVCNDSCFVTFLLLLNCIGLPFGTTPHISIVKSAEFSSLVPFLKLKLIAHLLCGSLSQPLGPFRFSTFAIKKILLFLFLIRKAGFVKSEI